MSQLYIRVRTGFYVHRKTLRLKATLGNDAYWVPPRIWAYCAENQPDGDLSDYSADELAMLIGYSGNASRMLQALKTCHFIGEDGKVHDWQEHNGFHSFYSARAKAAADARWSKKERTKERSTDKEKEKEPSIAPCIASSIEIPQNLSKEPFLSKWADWQKFRKAKKQCKDWVALFKEQLIFLSRFDANTATEILSTSIRNDYQGIFEPKNHSTNGAHSPNSATSKTFDAELAQLNRTLEKL